MKIFIGCGARDDVPQKYYVECEELLRELFKANDLVFGACTTGLMGVAHKTALKMGREIIAVTPEAYAFEAEDTACTQKIVTKTVGERTEKAVSLADATLFLPGGIGTVYELFSAIESKRCGEHSKKVVIFNLNGYYDELLKLFDKIYREGFAKREDELNYFVASTMRQVLDYLKN